MNTHFSSDSNFHQKYGCLVSLVTKFQNGAATKILGQLFAIFQKRTQFSESLQYISVFREGGNQYKLREFSSFGDLEQLTWGSNFKASLQLVLQALHFNSMKFVIAQKMVVEVVYSNYIVLLVKYAKIKYIFYIYIYIYIGFLLYWVQLAHWDSISSVQMYALVARYGEKYMQKRVCSIVSLLTALKIVLILSDMLLVLKELVGELVDTSSSRYN